MLNTPCWSRGLLWSSMWIILGSTMTSPSNLYEKRTHVHPSVYNIYIASRIGLLRAGTERKYSLELGSFNRRQHTGTKCFSSLLEHDVLSVSRDRQLAGKHVDLAHTGLVRLFPHAMRACHRQKWMRTRVNNNQSP